MLSALVSDAGALQAAGYVFGSILYASAVGHLIIASRVFS